MLKKILTTLLFFFFFLGYSQNVKLSEKSEISIITSGPGEELYEKFGHTAIRVKDPLLKLDLIYNYGIFDFDTQNFYLKFIRGFMNYKLARYDFYYALKNANREKRWVKEQILNFTLEEKNVFFTFLEHNAMPENANYFYDPYFDNCATKPRDIIKEVLGDNLNFANDTITNKKSLRQLMNKEIHTNTWGSFGINIALGSKLDTPATSEDAMYLPDYVFSVLNASTIKRKETLLPLVKKTKVLLNFDDKKPVGDRFSPFIVFSFVLLIGVFITYKDFKNKKRTKWFDFFIFFSTGLIGLLIVFLWFFTNHSTAPNNFNFLWAFAPNLLVAFYIKRKNPPKWILKYILFLLLLIIAAFIIWLTGVQLFSPYLILLLILFTIRYLFLQKTLNS